MFIRIAPLCVAAFLFAAPAWGQEDPDAPIATAPASVEEGAVDKTPTEPILIPLNPYGSGPWLHKSAPRTSGSMTLGMQGGYFSPTDGLDVANGKMTTQGTVSGTYRFATVELGGSKLLADKTGSERLANEAWLKVLLAPRFDTPVGDIQLELGATYRGLDHGQGVFSTRDDSTELLAGVGYPITFGSFELTPCVRALKSNPVGYNNSLYWFAECLTFSGPLPYQARFRFEFVDWHNVNSYTAVIHRNVWYTRFEASSPLPTDGWRMAAGLWFSQYGSQDNRFDMRVERDGRLIRIPERGRSPNKPTFTQYLTLSYTFY